MDARSVFIEAASLDEEVYDAMCDDRALGPNRRSLQVSKKKTAAVMIREAIAECDNRRGIAQCAERSGVTIACELPLAGWIETADPETGREETMAVYLPHGVSLGALGIERGVPA